MGRATKKRTFVAASLTKDNCELSDHAESEVVYLDVTNQKVDDGETANQNHDPVQTAIQSSWLPVINRVFTGK